MDPAEWCKAIILNHRKAVYRVFLGVVLLFILPIAITAISIVLNKDTVYDYHLSCAKPIKNPDMTKVVKTPPNREYGCIELWKNPGEIDKVLTVGGLGNFDDGYYKPGISKKVKFNDLYNCIGDPKDIFWNSYSNCYCQRDQERVISEVNWSRAIALLLQCWYILFLVYLIMLAGFLVLNFFYRHGSSSSKFFKKWGPFIWRKDFLFKIALILFIVFLIMRIFSVHLTLPSFGRPTSGPYNPGNF